MRKGLMSIGLAAGLATSLSGGAMAAALRVSPILVDAGAAANTTMTLTNNEARPIDAQVRVFRWSQRDGREELVPTDEVVASPPIVSIPAHEEYVVRLQHVGREPVGEESYRIVVDELPNPNRQRNGTVAVVLRYIVPAFFYSPDARQPRIKWSIGERDGKSVLVAENTGDKRIQMNNLALKVGGRPNIVAKGLAGYVLGHSSKEWPLSARLASMRAGTVVATSDNGAVSAPLAR